MVTHTKVKGGWMDIVPRDLVRGRRAQEERAASEREAEPSVAYRTRIEPGVLDSLRRMPHVLMR